MTILGRRKTEADDSGIFPYLASDEDTETDNDTQGTSGLKSTTGEMLKDFETKVYVWGLNDKDQLGGLRGSKASVVMKMYFFLICLNLYDSDENM